MNHDSIQSGMVDSGMVDLTSPRDLPTVMLIDDDMVSREVLATILTMGGYPIYTAEEGAAAIEMLVGGECVPAVVLMDAQMPGLNGTALIEKLRASSRASIFLISGSQPPDEMVAAADGFLMKPFGPETLKALLEKREATLSEGTPNGLEAGGLEAGERIINPDTLAQLREMMPASAVHQLYQAIVADLARRMTALEAAIAQNDGAEVRRIGHAIKGGCGMAGAIQAARLGGLLEDGLLEQRELDGRNGVNGINHLGDSTSILRDLRAAARNLERMLRVEFPA
jgi:CheY-like chemotaxis protein